MISYDKKRNALYINIFNIKLNISLNIERIIIKNLRPIISLLDLIVPKDEKIIVFNSYPNYSDNSYAYYKYMVEHHSKDYKLVWITLDAYRDTNINYKNYDLYSFNAIFNMIRAKYIISTHAGRFISFFSSSKHIYINLWHGMPIKTLGYCEKVKSKSLLKNYTFLAKNGYMFATSDVFKQLFIPCFKIDYDKVFITGHAKNDIIFSQENDDKVKEFLNINNYKKIVFYLPTYKSYTGERIEQIDKEFSNIFYMDDYNESEFFEYLKKENILFILKPHPMEEDLYKDKLKSCPKSENFKVIYNNDLKEKEVNLYELFKYTDLMISDFSSVTIDYLILNRPIIYLSNIEDEYKTGRGMVLEDNYTRLMPGTKVKDFAQLLPAITDNLNNDPYKELREKDMPLIHKYLDGNTCERIFEIMKGL